MSTWTKTATIIGAVGSGLLGGIYFSFSTFVMPGLKRLRSDQGIAAMQFINRAAPAPWVITGLIGTGGATTYLVVHAVRNLNDPTQRWTLAGSALYLASVLMTMGYHVPRNDAIDRLNPADPDSAAAWTRYIDQWTAGNHVRGLLAIAAAIILTVAATRPTSSTATEGRAGSGVPHTHAPSRSSLNA